MTISPPRFASLLVLAISFFVASPASAEWQPRPHREPDTNRSALYSSSSLSTSDVAQIRLSWSGRVKASDLDYRRGAAPLDPASISSNCRNTDQSDPNSYVNFCRSLSWDSADLIVDLIVDLEDHRFGDDPFAAIEGMHLQNSTDNVALAESTIVRGFGPKSVDGYVLYSCYESYREIARGKSQACDVFVEKDEQLHGKEYNRIAVVRASIPIWRMQAAYASLGGGKLALHMQRESGEIYAFTYPLDGLPDALFD